MQNADATVTESLAQVTNRQIRLIHQHKRLGFRRYIAGLVLTIQHLRAHDGARRPITCRVRGRLCAERAPA
jgi:hypothetical protein